MGPDHVIVEGLRIPFREMGPGDRAYVASTWIAGYRGQAREHVSRDVYLAEQPKLVDRLLDAHGAVVVHSPRVERTIYGWACGEPGVLHAVYVVPELRGQGVAKALIARATGQASGTVVCTHRWPGRTPAWVTWNPYRIGVTP